VRACVRARIYVTVK